MCRRKNISVVEIILFNKYKIFLGTIMINTKGLNARNAVVSLSLSFSLKII